MTAIHFINHVYEYDLIEESPRPSIDGESDDVFIEDVLSREEKVFFTCLVMCANRLEYVQADFFLLDEDVDISPENITKICSWKDQRGELIDIDVSSWLEKIAEYENVNSILQNMIDVFEALLLESLDRRLGCFFSRYIIGNPFQVVVTVPEEDTGKSELVYYPERRAVEIWGSTNMN